MGTTPGVEQITEIVRRKC